MAVAKYNVKVIAKEKPMEGYFLVSFERPQGFDYLAGQYVSIKVSEDGQRRSYSLASFPEDQEKIQLMVDISPMGPGSVCVMELEVGDTLEILGPMGRFTFEETNFGGGVDELIFVATGSGIVPMRSMIRHLLNQKTEKKLTLHWGMRFEGPFWEDEFNKLSEDYSNFKFDLVISKPSEAWTGCRGHVTDCLAVYPSLTQKSYYICGNQHMIMDVSQFLTERGVPSQNIFFEKFY
jgi:Na+-transporting NADH:ubiquinone oxidoreductase subunit F